MYRCGSSRRLGPAPFLLALVSVPDELVSAAKSFPFPSLPSRPLLLLLCAFCPLATQFANFLQGTAGGAVGNAAVHIFSRGVQHPEPPSNWDKRADESEDLAKRASRSQAWVTNMATNSVRGLPIRTSAARFGTLIQLRLRHASAS